MMKGSFSFQKRTIVALFAAMVLAMALVCAGCTSQSPEEVQQQTPSSPESTLGGASEGDLVELEYTGTLENGSVFDSSEGRGPFQFILGSGTAIEGFDTSIRGMQVGEMKKFTIPPEEAYGEYNETLKQAFPRSFIPEGEDVSLGDMVTLFNGQSFFQAKVIGLDEQNVTFDLNSPLAGETLTFEVTLVNLTPSSVVARMMSEVQEPVQAP